MKKHLLITAIVLILTPGFLLAQISGTKTIGGTNPDYTTFSQAVAALNSSGVSGPVVFNVAPGTYNEQISLNSISGTSATNTITFKSANNDSTSVILTYASSTSLSNNYVVKINGSSYITFESMTIKRSGTNNYCSVFEISGTSNNLTFKNNIIEAGISSSAVTYASLIYATNGTGNIHNNMKVINNRLVKGGVAVYNLGPSGTQLGTGLQIKNNIFENQGKYANNIYYQNAPVISGNTITATTTSSSYRAFNGNSIKGAFRFMNNKIAISGGTILFMQTSDGQSSKGLIANNFYSNTGSSGKAIEFSNTMNQNIYFNSINLTGSGAIGFKLTSNSAQANRFKNNIVKVSSGICMDIDNINNGFSELDYNNYYYQGASMGKINGTTYSTLAQWKTASGKDNHSVNYNPNFVSTTDLHINNSGLAQKGTSANYSPNVSVDIDNQTRSATTPDIGADEFTISDISVSAIHIDTQMCVGDNYSVTVDLKNTGTSSLTKSVVVAYQLGSSSSIQLGIASISNLAPGSTYAFTPSNKIPGNPLGMHWLRLLVSMQGDADASNDYDSIKVRISNYPVSNLPVDTSVCAGTNVVLDPGSGYQSYLWYNGATTQTLSVDSTGIGIGGKWISVSITDYSCTISDSTLVLFKDCTGMDNPELNNSLKIYPNPASNYVSIELNSQATVEKLRLIDTEGRMIIEKKDGDLSKMDISSIAKGVYYLQIKTSEGTKIKKLLIH